MGGKRLNTTGKKDKAMIYLDSDLKDRVSQKSVEKWGIRQGFFSMAVREALENWLKEK